MLQPRGAMASRGAKAAALQALQDMFGDIPVRNLRAALLANDYDVNDAANWLLTEGLADISFPSAARVMGADTFAATTVTQPTPLPTATPVPTPDAPLQAPVASTFAAVPTPPPFSYPSLMDAPMSASPEAKAEAQTEAVLPVPAPPPGPVDSFLFSAAGANASDSPPQPALAEAGAEELHPTVSPAITVQPEPSSAVAVQSETSSATSEAALGDEAARQVGSEQGGKHEEPTQAEDSFSAESASCPSTAAPSSVTPARADLAPALDTSEAEVVEQPVAKLSQASTPLPSAASLSAAPAPALDVASAKAASADSMLGSAPAVDSLPAEVEAIRTDTIAEDDAAAEQPLSDAAAPAAEAAPAEEVPADWVVTTPQDAADADGAAVEIDGQARAAEVVAVDDEAEDVEEAEYSRAGEEMLGWSVGSLSLLGSQLDVTATDRDSFDKVLGDSDSLKADLREGIESVRGLQARLSEVEAEAVFVEEQLKCEEAKEREEEQHCTFIIQKAREDVEMRADNLAGEKATLNFEARGLLKRLTTLNSSKENMEGELAKLRAVLEGRIREMEDRVRAAEKRRQEVDDQKHARKADVEQEMGAIVARQHALDQERAACDELKEFLADRSKAVDTIEGGIMQCSEEIQALCEIIMGGSSKSAAAAPSGEAQSASANNPSLATSLEAVLGEDTGAAAGEAAALHLSSRASMKEVLQGMLSSSEEGSSAADSNSFCSTPAMYASAEGVAPVDPRHMALEMLSFSGSRNGSMYSSLRGCMASPTGADAPGSAELADAIAGETAPVVRVFEGEVTEAMEGGANGNGNDQGNVAEATSEVGSAVSEKDDDWEVLPEAA